MKIYLNKIYEDYYWQVYNEKPRLNNMVNGQICTVYNYKIDDVPEAYMWKSYSRCERFINKIKKPQAKIIMAWWLKTNNKI